jgi:hypothetical protein
MSVFHNRCSLVLSILALFVLVAACGQQLSTSEPPSEVVETEVDSLPPDPIDAAPVQDEATVESTARPASLNAAATPPPAKKPAPRFVLVDVPAGTELEVELLDTLSSGTNQVGDPVRARLVGELFADGRLVAPAGAEVQGTVTDVVPLKKFGGQPSISMVFESLGMENGATVPVLASHLEAGTKQTGRDAAKIGGGAAAGAVIGHQVDDDKGSKLGALIGGAIGTAVAAKTGKEIELAAGTTIIVALESDVQVRLAP